MSALTTTFTPTPSCTTDLYTITSGNYYSIGGLLAGISQCFPSGWDSLSQYFSPGICPRGYTQACSNLSGSGTVTETRATCCPLNYKCYTETAFNFPGQACVSRFEAVETTVAIDAVALTTETVTLQPSTEAANGFGVSIRYKVADFISSTSSTSSPTITSFGGSLISFPTSLNPPVPTHTTSALSTGAKSGIGIGVGLVALLAIVGLAVFLARKRKREQQSHYPLQELPGSLMRQGSTKWGRQSIAKPQELYANISPAELENREPNHR